MESRVLVGLRVHAEPVKASALCPVRVPFCFPTLQALILARFPCPSLKKAITDDTMLAVSWRQASHNRHHQQRQKHKP